MAEKPGKIAVCLKIDRDMLDMLDEFAIENQISRSEVIRIAIKMLINRREERNSGYHDR